MQISASENLQKAINNAQNAALKYSNPEIGTEHVLYGLRATEESIAGQLLKNAGLELRIFDEIFKNSEHAVVLGGIDFTMRVKQTFQMADQLSKRLGLQYVNTEVMLFCLIQDETSYASNILEKSRVDIIKLENELKSSFSSAFTQGNTTMQEKGYARQKLPTQLRDLGVDLTQKAAENKIDPIIGRKEEIERIIQILCRKTKNNPVLIGEPGVGKSAVVEGLAKAIIEGSVPEILKDKIVFSLDIASLVAGTKYRGALEEKLKNAIDVITSHRDIIVFIDELHTLAQAGSKEGEVTPADILKPYLARGEMQTIGATTTDEYRKFIEKDKALERRFQPIIVAPPSVEETIQILKGLRENYETFHKVKITDEALETAAKLSDRYISDRFLPDKAIDLIDEAMSKAKVNYSTAPPDIKEMSEQLKVLEQQKQDAVKHEDYKKATVLRDEATNLAKKIEQQKLDWSKNNERVTQTIEAEQIAEIVAKWTKIPVTKLTETEAKRLMDLEGILHKRVIGQDDAIVSVAKAIRRARAGLKDNSRPVGSFLFLGPTGVGKTELTKALGEAMFDDENAVIRLDMSEYMEAHSVSKLIGAPPGYVGFDDGGQLTEQVRRRPYSVVLFDEIEKAHPDIFNSLLQILDDGRLTDSQGRTVSFKNTIVIMTSNVGASEIKSGSRSLGFSTEDKKADDARTESILMDALKRKFRPEFINRIDVISIFKALSREDIQKIALILLKKSEKALKERSIKLEVSDAAMNYILDKGYDAEYGARPLRRIIEQSIEDTIAEGILSGSIKNGQTALVDCIDGKITATGKN